MTVLILLQALNDSLVEISGNTIETADAINKNSSGWFNKITIKFFIRLFIDLVSLTVLIRGIYYIKYRNKAFFLPFVVFNVVIFLITYLLNKVDLSLGAAFGLFAIFGIMRYRSEDISIRNLTYLFLVIAIGLLSAISKGSWEEISLYNFIILAVVFFMESPKLWKSETSKLIIYDKPEYLKPENKHLFVEDMKNRTGYTITKFEIERIDYLRDAAYIRVFYEE
ncbi:MAG: DUF4956 domain-containing protein [Bacteroidia bacterium]|nr:DUF4956 domain-containing protein [Bacteroidia bacterium]